MDLTYPAIATAYRAHVREVLTGLLPSSWTGLGGLSDAEREVFVGSWRESLRTHGFLAPSWPLEYGGGGLSVIEQSIVSEELALLGVPQHPHPNDANGMLLLGPTVLRYGSEEQKRYFLPQTLSGEITWAQGYSEPEAGSDLFNLRTRAVREGDTWLVSGQKVWQTAGTTANWMFTLARTDPSQRGGRGLSLLLLPLEQPGIEVRGIRNMAGEMEFAEVFLDKAVAEDRFLVGGAGNGAAVALGLLGFERGAGGLANVAASRIELERLVELARARGLADDASVRRRIAACWTDVHTMKCLAFRALAAGMSDEPPGPESSITKMFISQYRHRVTELALDVLGGDAVSLMGQRAISPLKPQPLGTDPLASAAWIEDALHARPGTVYGGSLQIQRNTIGERVLGLPREPRPGSP
jgi:alkylation response protein AidB-like acyl-CoA dehydrogenase